MWQCCIISELRTVWQISNPISKELEARDFSRVSVHNMPEGLQSSYRGMCSEDAIDSMEEASEKIDEVIELLNDIMQNGNK